MDDRLRNGWGRKLRALTRRAAINAAAVCGLVGLAAPAQAQSDKFELKKLWDLRTDFGTIGLSTEVKRSGNTSLVLSSRSGGQRNIILRHTQAAPTRGKWQVWFYDTAPGQETLYSGISVYNSADYDNQSSGLNAADWSGTHYVWAGPGIGQTLSSVPRTAGWHLFVIELNASGFKASIDGTVVGTVPGDYRFDTVDLFLSGPVWRPNATYYFDDLKITKKP